MGTILQKHILEPLLEPYMMLIPWSVSTVGLYPSIPLTCLSSVHLSITHCKVSQSHTETLIIVFHMGSLDLPDLQQNTKFRSVTHKTVSLLCIHTSNSLFVQNGQGIHQKRVPWKTKVSLGPL